MHIMIDRVPGDGPCLAMRSRMTARALTRVYNAHLRPLDLAVTQFSLLARLKHGRYRALGDLAEEMAVERTTLVRNVQVLEARGLVAPAGEACAEGEADRAKRLRLTAAGETMLTAARPLWAAAQAEVEEAFGAESLAGAMEAMRALAGAAARLEPGRGQPRARGRGRPRDPESAG